MKKILAFTFILSLFSVLLFAQNLNNSVEKNWNPQNDDVYLQEVSVKIATDNPVISIAESGGICFALVGNQLFRVENETLKQEN